MDLDELSSKITTKLYLENKRRYSCKYFHYLNMERVKERKKQLPNTNNNNYNNTPNFANNQDAGQLTNNNVPITQQNEHNNTNSVVNNNFSDSDQEMSRTDLDQALEDDISFLVEHFHVEETEPTYMPYIC